MIVFYTGTGNAKYVAEKIAEITGDVVENLTTFTKEKKPFALAEDEKLVLVSPVYYWGVPETVKEFVKSLKDVGNYFALVLECGGNTGDAQGVVQRYAEPSAVFGLVAVDNFCPMFKVPTREEAECKLDALDEKIAFVAEKIKNEEKGDFNDVKGTLPKLNTAFLYPLYEKFGGRKTKFSVSNDCIGCGHCEEICPTSTICVENGKPVWTKTKCDMCLGCLSRCPKNAISIKNSMKNGRFVNPRVKF